MKNLLLIHQLAKQYQKRKAKEKLIKLVETLIEEEKAKQ